MQASTPTLLDSTPAVLGLVLTLETAAPELAATLTTLWETPGLKLDEQRGPFLALSADTTDPRALHRRIESMPGVKAVDVVFVEVLSEPDSGARRPRRHTREPADDFLIPDAEQSAASSDPDLLQP